MAVDPKALAIKVGMRPWLSENVATALDGIRLVRRGFPFHIWIDRRRLGPGGQQAIPFCLQGRKGLDLSAPVDLRLDAIHRAELLR